MDSGLSYSKISVKTLFSSPVGTHRSSSANLGFWGGRRTLVAVARVLYAPLEPRTPVSLPQSVGRNRSDSANFGFRGGRRAVIAAARGGGSDSGSECVFSGLNAPLELKTPAGRLLSSVFQNDRRYFHDAVQRELEKLVRDRDEALVRMNLSLGSDEAILHRKIAELKELECRSAVEDVMYLLIVYKFSQIRVHLIPRLSKCMYNGRLEIWPCKDWELESIHSIEVLEMVREHVTSVVGWKEKSNVTDNWAPTQVKRLELCRVYSASVLYGYFLKSASFRYRLEQSLHHITSDLGITTSSNLLVSDLCSLESNSVSFGRISGTRSTSVGQISAIQGKLRSYLLGFNTDTLLMCAKPEFKEALNLIEKHSYALFGDEKTGLLESDEVVSTSLASLKRIVLEAVAFGSFLWDAEEYIRTLDHLEEN